MMHHRFNRAVASMAALAIGVLLASPLFAGDGNNSGVKLTAVQSANPKAPGLASPNIRSPELTEVLLAQGSSKLENTSDLTNFYGYDNDGPMLPPAICPPWSTKWKPPRQNPTKTLI